MQLKRIPPVLPGRRKGITISKDERDALFERSLLRLNAIDALQHAIDAQDWNKAAVLGREFSDLLAFATTDLGWGPQCGSEFTLRTPTDVLRRAVEAIQREAECDSEIFADDLSRAQQEAAKAETLLFTCRRISVALLRAG